jgi:hypothetical protein
VVRHRIGQRIAYDFEETIMQEFFENNPTQASYMLVHEWLWDFYESQPDGSPRIRSANGFLHSRASEFSVNRGAEFKRRVFDADPHDIGGEAYIDIPKSTPLSTTKLRWFSCVLQEFWH